MVPDFLPVLPWHARRDSQITEALTRREKNFCVAIGQNRPWVGLRRAHKIAAIEADAAVRLVGKQEDAPPDPYGSVLKQLSESKKHVTAVNAPCRIMRGVDDDEARLSA